MSRLDTDKSAYLANQEEVEMDDRNGMSGTAKDAQEMERLGKQQQLNVSA